MAYVINDTHHGVIFPSVLVYPVLLTVNMTYVINDTSHVVLMPYELACLMTLMAFVMLFQCNGGSHVQ